MRGPKCLIILAKWKSTKKIQKSNENIGKNNNVKNIEHTCHKIHLSGIEMSYL